MSAAIRRRLFLLGSTGSIGTSALDVVRDFERRGERRFEIVGLAAARNGAAIAAQACEWVIATASASAASGPATFTPGRCSLTM